MVSISWEGSPDGPPSLGSDGLPAAYVRGTLCVLRDTESFGP